MAPRVFAEGLLEGQVVVVAGDGSGLGRAAARELTACAATVLVAGGRRAELEETAHLCAADRCEPVECDLLDEAQVERLVDGVLDRHGHIDTLVNDPAALGSPGEDAVPTGFRDAVRASVEGTWLATHAVATKAMIPAGGGRVVTATPSQRRDSRGAADSAAASAAVKTMTRTLATEWARFQIRLVALAGGRPEEQAPVVAYLASPAGDYHSGSVITLGAAR